MAGCKPEYFPVVVAAFEALFDASFNAHTALTSTGGAALAVVVSGPIAEEIGMNGRHNCLGSGNRANLTIGRAVRLAAMNVLGARSGELDASSFGHPGKISFCFAEDPPPAPWLPLHEQLGYEPGDTTVTVMPVEGVRQLAQQLNGDAEGILRTFADGDEEPVDLLDRQGRPGADDPRPGARRVLHRAGVDAGRRCASSSARRAGSSPEELMAVGVLIEVDGPHGMIPGEDGKLASVPRRPTTSSSSPREARARAGRPMSPSWAPKIHARASTRRVRPTGEPLPDCGPGRLHRALAEGYRMSTITVFPPGRRGGAADDRRARATAAGCPRRPVIGIVDNRKPHAREILELLADELGSGSATAEVVLLQKKGAGNPMPPEMASDMAARAHLVITGVGD